MSRSVRLQMTARAFKLISELQTAKYGLRVLDLAERLETSRQTINRDLKDLTDLGFAIERRLVNGEMRYSFSGKPPPPFSPTPAQHLALRLARLALKPLEGTELLRELDALLASSPDLSLPEHLSFREPQSSSSAYVRTIESAIKSEHQLELLYAPARSGKPELYVVDPLFLRIVGDDQLYLAAHVPARNGPRKFKVSRIRACRYLESPLSPHPGYTVEQLFGRSVKAWGGEPVDVSVKIDPSVAHLAKDCPLIDDQHLEHRDDGSVVVHARVAGLIEVKGWVHSWCGSAEVLAPPELRRMVQDDLEAALERYRRKPARRSGEVGSRKVSGRGGGAVQSKRRAERAQRE